MEMEKQMNSLSRATKVVAALMVTAAFPIAAVAPAAATTSFETLTIDCATDLSPDGGINFPLFGYPLNVTLVNCETDNVWDEGVTTNATIGGTAAAWTDPLDIVTTPATLVIDGPVNVEFRDAVDYLLGNVVFDNPIDLPNPDGVLLSTDVQEIPVVAPEFSVGTQQEIDDSTEVELSDGCWYIAGSHVYATTSLSVSQTSEYTLRVVDQSPTGTAFHPNDGYSPWDDSVIVIYSSFDPAHPEDNIVGCGDELIGNNFDPQLDSYGWYRTVDGDPISIGWPNFWLDMAAGEYTVVYASYDTLSSEQWAAGEADGETWDVGPQSITTELWGPEDGAALTDEALASTGVDPSFGLWTGLALASTGVAITVARRRANRA